MRKKNPESFTPGPWRWEAKVSPTNDGRKVHPEIRLMTTGVPGGFTVMDFQRMGMAQAAPRFLSSPFMKAYSSFVSNVDHNGYGTLSHPDARLIAAAPDLYAALHAVLVSACPTATDNPQMWSAWEQARIALAKATGDVS